MISLVQILLFLACLAGSAFFAAAETALTSVSLSTWERLLRDRPWLSSPYHLWSSDPSLVMATLLFCNTFSSLGASVAASALMRDLAEVWHLSAAMFLGLTSLLAGTSILVAGEILPKLYARHNQQGVLIHSAGPLFRITVALRPFLNGLARLADGVKEMFSHRPPEPLITADELRQALVEIRSDSLAPASRRILSNIMAFDQIKVRDVMIPRAHVVAVRMEQDYERVFERIVRSGFSRIPIYFGNIDNILGIVYAKDLLVEWRSSGLLVLEDLLRPPYRIVPDAPLSVLLQGFRQGHHLAIVTDSLGRTQGIVTVEDAVEAIVGDIADEFDQPSSLHA